ncbi:alpha/beta fold hydrolase [Terrilactibacillus laevilacticus]|uniref:Alpha/beta fold hydrolase n=1 Tax=Terrilactibacillus laevilacticus TaxID=1380157 RepID=A0ABW5PM86_9BACI|nr:alpha/beta hydrolase [Terrilactibacillus laevilacticus]
MSYIQMNDYKLYYEYFERHTCLPTVVLIQNLGHDSTSWKRLLPYFITKYNVLVYDFYGHGKTGSSSRPLNLKQLHLEFRSLLSHLSLADVHLIGCSFGGNLALNFATTFQDDVQSITLLSTPFRFPSGLLHGEHMEQTGVTGAYDYCYELAKQMIYPIDEEKLNIVLQAMLKIPLNILIQSTTLLIKEETRLTDITSVTQPVLILHGEYDPIFPAKMAILYASHFKKARALMIANSSSEVALDRPDVVASFVDQFLDDITTKVPARKIKTIKGAVISLGSLRMEVMKDYRVTWNNQLVEGHWLRRHARDFLLFLIMNKGSVTRDKCVDEFFSNLDYQKAKNHLRVTLNHLKNIFRQHPDLALHDALIITRDQITLKAHIECDLLNYQQALDHLFDPKFGVMRRYYPYMYFIHFDVNRKFGQDIRGEWATRIHDHIEDQLHDMFLLLVDELKQRNLTVELTQLLQQYKLAEPYPGYCQEELKNIEKKKKVVG